MKTAVKSLPPIEELSARIAKRLTERGFTFNESGTQKVVREEIERQPSHDTAPYFDMVLRNGGAASQDRDPLLELELENQTISPHAALIFLQWLSSASNNCDGGPGYEYCWCEGAKDLNGRPSSKSDRSVEQVHSYECRRSAIVWRWLLPFAELDTTSTLDWLSELIRREKA